MIDVEPSLLSAEMLTSAAMIGDTYEPWTRDADSGGGLSTGYAEDGTFIVGEKYTDAVLVAYDSDGQMVGLAFGDGDGNWDNELLTLANGLACGAGIGLTVTTGGAAAIFGGIAAVGSCIEFGVSFSNWIDEYNSADFGNSVTINLDGIGEWCYDFNEDGYGDTGLNGLCDYRNVKDGIYHGDDGSVIIILDGVKQG